MERFIYVLPLISSMSEGIKDICDHKSLDLGYLQGSRESLIETAYGINNIIGRIEDLEGVEGDAYEMVYLWGSRGSLPFVAGLNYIHTKKIRENMRLRVIPHVHSIENLLEIVSDYDKVQDYNSYKPVMDAIYEDIADSLSRKIADVLDPEKRSLLTDWDEVNTGRNFVERFKIYNSLEFPEDVSFYIVSFMGERRKRLEHNRVKTFHRLFEKSPPNYMTVNALLENPLTWSDNEPLYSTLGLEYPGIAVPPYSYITNLLRMNALPEFYMNFFKNFSTIFSESNTDLSYCLVLDDNLFHCNEERLLECSFDAYKMAINQLDESAFKRREKGAMGYRFDNDAGQVHILRKNGEEKVMLERKHPTAQECYRHPFILVSQIPRELPPELDQIIADFMKGIKGREIKSGLIVSDRKGII